MLDLYGVPFWVQSSMLRKKNHILAVFVGSVFFLVDLIFQICFIRWVMDATKSGVEPLF